MISSTGSLEVVAANGRPLNLGLIGRQKRFSRACREIAVRRTDATAESGTLLLAILYNRAPHESVFYSE